MRVHDLIILYDLKYTTETMQPSDLNYTEYLNMTFSCQTNRTTRKEQYIICIVQNEALKKSKLLPDARLGDLLMKCQITKYIYHLLFFFQIDQRLPS